MQNFNDEQHTLLWTIATTGERLRDTFTTIATRVQSDLAADRLAYDLGLFEDELLTDLVRVQTLICGIPMPID